MEDRELQDPAHWDMEHAELRAPVKSPRSVVSVSFGQDDLALVVQAARERGMKTSEFIRSAAMVEAQPRHRKVLSAFSGGASQGITTVLTTNWRRGGRSRFIMRTPAGPTEVVD